MYWYNFATHEYAPGFWIKLQQSDKDGDNKEYFSIKLGVFALSQSHVNSYVHNHYRL